MNKKYSLVMFLFLTAFLGGCCSTSQSRQTEFSSDIAGTVNTEWNAIKALDVPRTMNIPERAQWLVDSMGKSNIHFMKICDGSNLYERLSCYVDKFGRDGPEADLAWILAQPRLLLADHFAVTSSYPRWPDNEERGEFREGYRQIERLVCRAEVERFLREPQVFRRYYRALVWSCMLLHTPDAESSALHAAIGNLLSGFPSAPDEDYWCYARNFMLLAHATGRDDLLVKVDSDDLRQRFLVWREWWIGNEELLAHLRPDNKNLVWHFDPTWTSVESLAPLEIPDRPFEEMDTVMPIELQFNGLVLAWQEEDLVASELMTKCAIPLGRDRIKRKVTLIR